MKRFKNILFVSDRPGPEPAAFQSALALAEANRASLTVMDVVEPMTWSAEKQARFGTDLTLILRDRRHEELQAMTAPYTDRGLAIRTQVAVGTSFLEIIRAVLRNRFDLLIKTAGKEGDSAALSSNDQHLVRKCPCPVWIDRDQSQHPYRRILAAVDPLGDEDKGLAKMILDLALSVQPDAEVHVVHAWRLPGESMLRRGRAKMPELELERLLEEQEQRHANALEALLKGFGIAMSERRVHFHKSAPASLIIEVARQLSADLIVTGTVGRTGIPGFFIGNTAETLMRSINVPVLAVKPEGFVSPVTLS